MAEKIECGVPGCGRTYEPGRGGVGGEKPRCGMHYARERRGSPEADEPGKLHNGDKAIRITINAPPKLAARLVKMSKASGQSVSEYCVARILEAMPKNGKRAGGAA